MRALAQRLRPLDQPSVGRSLFLSFLLVLTATHEGVLDPVRVWAAMIAVAGLVVPGLAERSRYWFALAFTLALNLFFFYEDAANHFWVTFYTALYFALDSYRREGGREPSLNIPRGLLAIVFGFATLQKLLSTYFMSGRLLAGYFLRGSSLFSVLVRVFPDHWDLVDGYVDAHEAVSAAAPLQAASEALPALPEHFQLLCIALAVGIVVAELAIFVFLVVNPLFKSALYPIVMLGFVWGTFVFRPEYAFFSLVCILVLLSRPDLSVVWKALIALSAFVLLAFEVVDLAAPF